MILFFLRYWCVLKSKKIFCKLISDTNLANYSDLISVRIAIGSGTAFLVAQLIDVNIFDKLRNKVWFAAPLFSSLIGSTIDTFLFFSISFYGTGINWINLSLGDLLVKIFVSSIMLIPFRIFILKFHQNREKKIIV